MKKYILFGLLFTSVVAFSQDTIVSDGLDNFNKWSIELNTGQNKPVRPFATGYYSSNPNEVIGFTGVNHYDIGLRYMLSDSFGLKLDFANDQFRDLQDAGSLPFKTQSSRLGLQGVVNMARLLRFELFTSRIGLLGHGGIHFSNFEVRQGFNTGTNEYNGGVMFGMTPQVRLTDWLAFTADFTVVNNVRQHLNWDGSFAISDSNLSGILYTTSLGFTVYFGKNKKHADWFIYKERANSKMDVDHEARKRLDEIEVLMNDTDRDGVPDYRDSENNTPSGLVVDAKGRYIDANNNGTPDELEPKRRDSKIIEGISADTNQQNVSTQLIENGFVNFFFDINKDIPNAGSTNNLYYTVAFLKDHPESKILLNGYADSRGNEKDNVSLSKRRVQNVYDLLVASGIQKSRIDLKGNGVDSQVIDTSLGHNLARRVSVILIK